MSNKVLTELYAHMNTVPLTRNEHLEEERSVPQASEKHGCHGGENSTLPKRPWIGLTKDEVELLSYKADGNTWKAVELAEAKLKEKNHE